MYMFHAHFVCHLGRKCTWTASGCPNCFKGAKKMGKAPKRLFRYRYCTDCLQHTRHDLTLVFWHTNRSPWRMRLLRRALISKRKQKGKAEEALKQGRRLGVNLQFDNPWSSATADEWVFGPDAIQDNIYRCLPQVNLHGMDEGLTVKLNFSILHHALEEVAGTKRVNVVM